MKRAIFVAVVGFVVLVLAGPGEAQVPGRGFTALLCLAGIDGEGTYNLDPVGNIAVIVSNDDGSSATFEIKHGEDGSTHIVTYDDTDDNQQIDCGDRVLSVS